MSLDPMVQAAEFVEKHKTRRKPNACAQTGVCYDDGELWLTNNTACHAGLDRNYYGEPDGRAIAVVSYIQNKFNCSVELEVKYKLKFLDWLFNRSPYAETFYSKDAAEVLTQGYSVSNPNTPNNLMIGGLIASRRIWEYAYIARIWAELVELTGEENLAYIYAHCLKGGVYKENCASKNIEIGSSTRGHCSIDVEMMDITSVCSFVNSDPINLNGLYVDTNTYGRINSTWGGGVYNKRNICKEIGNIKLDGGGVVENLNPFPPILDDDGITSGEFSLVMPVVADHLIKYVEGMKP